MEIEKKKKEKKGGGWGGGGLHRFGADCKFVGKMRFFVFVFWHPIARATIYCLLPDTF